MRYLVLVAAAGLSCSMQPQVPMYVPSSGSPFATGTQPADVVVCDLDGDGSLDLLTANVGSNDVTVLLGNGTGEFDPAPDSPVPAGIAAHLIACADLTGDGNPDIAVTSHDSNDVVVLLGDGHGSLRAAPGSPFAALRAGEAHNHGLLLVDVDGDGNLDIVTTNQADGSLSVLHGNGRGGFMDAPGSPFAVGRMPYLPAAGDVDGDGVVDLLVPNARDDDVAALLGGTTGSLAPASGSPYPVEPRPYFVGLADLNGDGKLDLVTSQAETALLTILLGDGRGGFAPGPGSPLDGGFRGYKVRFGDLNLDGNTDLVTTGVGDGAIVLLGDGRGAFQPAPGSPFATGGGPWGVAVADVNSDGKLDIITANSNDDSASVLLAN